MTATATRVERGGTCNVIEKSACRQQPGMVRINGKLYWYRWEPDGAAVHLWNDDASASYRVRPGQPGCCDCPDATYRRADCKHRRGLAKLAEKDMI